MYEECNGNSKCRSFFAFYFGFENYGYDFSKRFKIIFSLCFLCVNVLWNKKKKTKYKTQPI